jgi:hypothetical protein
VHGDPGGGARDAAAAYSDLAHGGRVLHRQLPGADHLRAARNHDGLQDRARRHSGLRAGRVTDERRDGVRGRLRCALQQGFLGRAEAFTLLQLIGLGHAAGIVSVAVASWTEARRLKAARAGPAPMSIAWLLPQYVAMAVTDASFGVGHFEFFYDQAPETMKGASTAFYFLSVSLGNLLSSQLVKLVAAVTEAGGTTGWFPQDMNDGHLDYYFLLIVGITAVNFAVFVYLAKNYTPKIIGR